MVVSRRSKTPFADEPTLPVQRKLAWDEEEQLGEREEIEQDRLTDGKKEGETRDENGMERNERYVLVPLRTVQVLLSAESTCQYYNQHGQFSSKITMKKMKNLDFFNFNKAMMYFD